MASTKNHEFSISIALVLGLLVVVGLVYMFVFTMAEDGFGKNMERVKQEIDGDLLARIRPVVTLEDIIGSGEKAEAAPAAVAMKSPKELYDGACMACHSTGVAGAPKLGDAAAWGTRAEAGLDAMIQTAIAGKGAMPPNGGSAYSEQEMKTTIEFMLAEAGLMDAPAAEAPAVAEPMAEAAEVQVSVPSEVAVATASASDGMDLVAGENNYRIACFACHDTGAANAPKLGDNAAWSARIAAGFDTLMQNAINGKGGMPPKGGAMHLSDEDIANVVAFIVEKSR